MVIKRTLLNRIEQLEASQAKDPELLAQKIADALDQMIRTLPIDYSVTNFEEVKLRLFQGHHVKAEGR